MPTFAANWQERQKNRQKNSLRQNKYFILLENLLAFFCMLQLSYTTFQFNSYFDKKMYNTRMILDRENDMLLVVNKAWQA